MRSSLFPLVLALAAYGQPSPKPALSLSPTRLARIDRVLQKYIDDNRVAGAVALVLQDGKPVYEHAFGWADKEAGRKMTPDTIFRIASQTKAFTSAAVLALVEEGKIGITEPVSDFIPTFAKTTVAVKTAGGIDIVPAKRRITIADLLTHTAGISYGTDAHVAPSIRPKDLDPPPATAGTRPTKKSPFARPWSGSARYRLSPNPARRSSTATTPTSLAASSRRHPACRSTNSSVRASPNPSA